MARIVLDGAAIESRTEALEAFAPYFPDYYGRNLDALWDCLTDFPEPLEIRVRNSGLLQENLGPFWLCLQRVLEQVQTEKTSIAVVMDDGEMNTTSK